MRTEARSIMTHDAETGDLVCFAPAGEELLRMVETDFAKAHSISAAIQAAFQKGHLLGRLALQAEIEQHMDQINRR